MSYASKNNISRIEIGLEDSSVDTSRQIITNMLSEISEYIHCAGNNSKSEEVCNSKDTTDKSIRPACPQQTKLKASEGKNTCLMKQNPLGEGKKEVAIISTKKKKEKKKKTVTSTESVAPMAEAEKKLSREKTEPVVTPSGNKAKGKKATTATPGKKEEGKNKSNANLERVPSIGAEPPTPAKALQQNRSGVDPIASVTDVLCPQK